MMDHRPAEGHEVERTGRRGAVRAPYALLVQLFGQPERDPYGNAPETNVEWSIMFADGTAALVYDQYELFDADDPVEKVTYWTINGHDVGAVGRVADAIRAAGYEPQPEVYRV